ncbi:Lipoprotein NlpI [Pseudidiomarina piscicola]|uniref:Lipoprotein NlpI n=1 Tax=Pseudidiomarina piscicola TaxID=2614830 RepID=A0A6S6WKW8_9GAMM|nr:lipoprotein NlpI [Pseudidiomarina piscicola]CAB0149600.1 Lipoprotein NlpI [Pseudidiomarina piscicola]VZT39048.1 Lipoprotein NlpI [Pseudomonas aeruginosa]
MSFNRLGWMVLLGCLSISGCTLTPPADNTSLGHLVLVKPQTTDGRFELEVAKLTEVISKESDQLEAETMGQLLYRRGSLYDALGLVTLARIDFNRALDYQPRLADAYNYLGIHYTQLSQFNYAYESFDAVLELEPDHPYAYLNRGIASYYDQRFDLAVDDFNSYFAAQPSDPYRAMWVFLAEMEQAPTRAMENLAKARLEHGNDIWAWGLVDLYLGVMTESEFLQSYVTQGLSADETLAERMCEAYFYLGKYKQLQGQWQSSSVYFRLALSTNVHMFLEHRYASIELERSQQHVDAQRSE